MIKNKKKQAYFLLLIVLFFITLFLWPLPAQLQTPHSQLPTRILDRNGQLLYEVRHPEYGSQNYAEFKEIPENLLNALIAIEDRSFYSHWGVSPTAIIRAAWQNISSGEIISGGSTITQQLVRTKIQPGTRTYFYKAYEAFLALKLESRLSKEEILEQYLNSAYFGNQAYGIKAAANTFFNKSLAELSLAESSLLIGLVQSPSRYNPFKNFEEAKARQQRVLAAMRETDLITTPQLEDADAEPITLTKNRIEIKAPHFVFYVLDQLESEDRDPRLPSPYRRGTASSVPTTLDLALQSEVELIVANKLDQLKEKNVSSAAVVVLDAHTGEILSMVGSADYFDEEHDGQVNVATSARQPGSTLKPFTYALGLQQGMTAATTIADIETQFFTQDGNPYIPRNYDFGYHGLVRIREALANSYNIPAVRVLEKVGVPKLLNFLKQAGITTLNQTPDHYGIALTLGDGEVTLLELTQAYGMFARQGKPLVTRFIASQDSQLPTPSSQLHSPHIAYLITDILSDNQARLEEFGENSPLSFDFPVAAKTGTTRNSRDNWTIGYSADRIVGVWVGNADNSPMRETTGITGAAPIFHDVMIAAMNNIPKRPFERPPGIIEKTICKLSGKLPTKYCPHTMNELFIAGTEPKEPDTLYQPRLIDTRNSLLASSTCAPQFTREEIFIRFPIELQKWARENGYPEAPKTHSPLCSAKSEETNPRLPSPLENEVRESRLHFTITRPNPNDSFQLDPLIPNDQELIIFEAQAESSIETLDWYVGNIKIGTAKSPDFRLQWQPKPGNHEISAQSASIRDTIHIQIIEN